MTDFLIIEDGKVFRRSSDLESARKIIDVLDLTEDNRVVKTKVSLEKDGFLEHEYIFPVIYSGEYTTSMAYDVLDVILNMSTTYLDKGLYMCDALPHNYTYNKGRWVLYDFGAFELSSRNVKTLIRNVFKIAISSFELLKMLPRKDLKHYFLNRVSHTSFAKMVSLKTFMSFLLKSELCLFLSKLNLNKYSYLLAKYYFKKYVVNYKKEYFLPTNLDEEEKESFDLVDNFLQNVASKTVFAIGEISAKWAVVSILDCEKFVYLDDYDFCDKYYNYIYINGFKTVSTAVVYPFFDDENIPEDLTYRGIYDSFARERFCSDAVVVFDISELVCSNSFDIKNYIKHISGFAKKSIFLGFDKLNEQDIFAMAKQELSKYFDEITVLETKEKLILSSNNKKDILYPKVEKYRNANRSYLANAHSEKIIEILKNRK